MRLPKHCSHVQNDIHYRSIKSLSFNFVASLLAYRLNTEEIEAILRNVAGNVG